MSKYLLTRSSPTGLLHMYKVFRHLKCAICGWLVYVKKIALYIKFLLLSYPHSLNILFNSTSVMASNVTQGHSQNLHMFGPFYHWLPPKWILKTAVDSLEIQLGIISTFNQLWISSISMAASKIHFWRLSMIKWSKQTCVNHENGIESCLRLQLRPHLVNFMKFSKNVGMIPSAMF